MTTTASFADRLSAAFDRARGARGLNLVSLSVLRAALSDVPREAFDAQLYALRRANLYVLHTFDGRHGKLTDEQIAASIVEDGRTFVFAAKREVDAEPEAAPVESSREALLTRILLAVARADVSRLRRALAVLE